MAEKAVEAEVKAIRELRTAVARYAEQMRDAMAEARHGAAALVTRTEAILQQRKSRLDRAMRELEQAQAALAACRDPKRSAVLQRAVTVANAHAGEARQFYAHAQKAATIAATTQSDLLKTMQALEAVVGEQSSVSSSALASLEGKLGDIKMPGSLGERFRQGIKVAGVTAGVVTAGVSIMRTVGDASQGRLPIADSSASISEMQQEHARQDQESYADSDLKWREDHSGEVPKP